MNKLLELSWPRDACPATPMPVSMPGRVPAPLSARKISTRNVVLTGLTIGALISLSACTTPPSAPPPPTPAPAPEPVACAREPVVQAPAEPSPVEAMLVYHQNLKALNPAELQREMAGLNTLPKTPASALRKAMVLSMSRAANDLALAQIHLDSVLGSTDPEAEPLKPLARVLGTQWSEQRRLSDALDKLNAQARDNQRKTEQLTEKLEALKAIERTLPASPASPSAPGPAASTSPAKQGG